MRGVERTGMISKHCAGEIGGKEIMLQGSMPTFLRCLVDDRVSGADSTVGMVLSDAAWMWILRRPPRCEYRGCRAMQRLVQSL
ncbi:unnamed protein product [Merluccius merluccius]